MKQLKKIANIDPQTAPPVYRRHARHQSGKLIQWLMESELSVPQQRIAERYQNSLVARLHPQRSLVELYIDPAVVSPADRLMIELVFKKC